MERHKKDKRHRKKPPRVPIKTYRWEDVRRARLRGGYPWTYLYKDPFNERIDPKRFVMEATPKSKSSLSLQKSAEGIDIKEITNGIEHENHEHLLTPEPSGYIVITEVPSDSENHSKNVSGGSVTIEDVDEPEVLNLESAESSDNISQYLDKEEPVIEPTKTTAKTDKTEDAGTSKNGQTERAKSEEPKRKRKLSIDSSYSRKSLSKLAIIKKLKAAKEKIKIPKINLPIPRKQESAKEKKKEPEEIPQDIMKFIKPPKHAKPVYIHIPLKPPEGQTDEFSYLEFGEKKPEEDIKPEKKNQTKETTEPDQSATKDQSSTKDQASAKDQVKPNQSLLPKNYDQRRYSEHPDDIIAIEIVKAQSIDLDDATGNGLDELCILQHNDEAHKDDIMIYLPVPEEAGPSRLERKNSKNKTPSRQGSVRGRSRSAEPEKPENRTIRAKSAEPERKRKLSVESSHSRISLTKLGILKKLKNAKEKFKFPTLSLSRSNSKKELKKTKTESETKETKVEAVKPAATGATPKYIHIPLKPPPGQTDEFSYLEFEEPKEEEKKVAEPKKDETEKTERKEETEKTERKEETEKKEPSSLESPASVQNEGVQFIFLTPPSDDELLDHPEIPETPSESNKTFFATDTLKQIAEEAVDKVSPKSRRKNLESVSEEDDKNKTSQTSEKSDEDKEKSDVPETSEKMVVDEEDGLKLTESAMAKQEQNIKSKEVPEPSQELKSSLKADGSPTLKKKVAFKKRSKDDSKDGIYEDIQAPIDANAKQEDKGSEGIRGTISLLGNSQSMSVEEEKSYLDEQKIIKTTSLEEDYNRWSKLSDHEYEPVNPPPDNNVGWKSSLQSATSPTQPPAPAPAPTVHVMDTDQGLQARPISQASSTTSLERRMLGAEIEPSPQESFTVQEMQTQIESKFFSKTPKAPSKQEAPRQPTVPSSEPEKPPPKTEGPGKFQQAQQAIKTQAGKFKTKIHSIKKPNIKIQKPNIHLPKMPNTTKINLPSFSLPRKNPLKRSLKQRQLSTESNAGDSKTNYFDFRTYPRLFKKKHKDDFDSSFSSKSEREVPEFATVPRTKRNQGDSDRWGGRDTIRIPLHPEDSVEDNNDREDSVERRMAAHMRYDQDIDIDDAYERENQEIHTASPFSHAYTSRWNHGSFHPEPTIEYRENNKDQQVTDLDSPGDAPAPNESFDTNTSKDSKDIHSSESSLGIHRRGVLEEIDSDEFFLRQKGISQDNIEVGMYLSSEIREAFKSPTNALADLQKDPREFSYEMRASNQDPREFSYEMRASNQSLPETPSKRKVIKKPKRKKTPHVSQEQISYDQDSEPELTEIPPSRPKRRSKRNRKPKETENVIPYQETIAVDAPDENLGILSNHEEHEKYKVMYENEQMQGKEQPEIKVTDPYANFRYEERYDSDDEVFGDEAPPAAPPRRNRSLKSLNFSEHDSILGDFNLDKEPLSQDIEVYKTEHEYIIPTPELPPVKPPRTLSRSSSKSRENEEILEEVVETPVRPTRTRSQSQTRSRAESLTMEPEPCIEEPCVQDFRDHMGYAVIDKNLKREPPLPPPRTPPRRKRAVQSAKATVSEQQRFSTVPRPLNDEPPSVKAEVSEQRFFTVPRPLNDEPPTRPLRNYSTLGPSRPPRRKPPVNMTDEEKENIDITQYIEIEDEPNRDLHSGEVIQKMRDRPLPAPPRPPRKTKTLQDITSQENIFTASRENIPDDSFDIDKPEHLDETRIVEELRVGPEDIQGDAEETEVSTQTEPLPDDFVCEELVQEEHDKTIIPSMKPKTGHTDDVIVRKELITPTRYSYEEETITHGSLVVEPLNGAKILPDSDFTRREAPTERFIPVIKDYDDDETSEIPEEFTKLKDPAPARTNTPQPTPEPQPIIVERIIERPVLVQPDSSSEVEVLRAQKLQVTDLDVDRLSVNELLASRIIVSEIDSGSIQANEISSKSGALKLGEIELPPGVVQQLFERLQSVVQEQQSGPIDSRPVAETSSKKEESEDAGQKKTPFENVTVETLPQRPPRKTEETRKSSVAQIDDSLEESQSVDVAHIRTDSQVLEIEENDEIREIMEPPEPPQRSDSSIRPAEPQPVKDTALEAEEAPQRPPRYAEKIKSEDQDVEKEFEVKGRMEEPEIDDEPPPRPPEPRIEYVPSQPPPSFYALRAQQYLDSFEGDIPTAPRRRRQHKPPISRSSSDDSPAPPPSRRRYRSPEPTIPQLTGQLLHACGSAAHDSIKRLIAHITNNILRNADGQQDMHVIMVILLVLIAGLILLGFGNGKTVHHHHWEYFNPPRDT